MGEPEEALELFGEVDRVVELAIGNRTDVAETLVHSGIDVVATDVRPREVPRQVEFTRDDLTDPDFEIYRNADLLYARRLPGELQHAAVELARAVDRPLYFTTLGFERPVVSVEVVPRHAVTWYRSR